MLKTALTIIGIILDLGIIIYILRKWRAEK